MNFKGKPSYLDQHGATKVRGDDGDGEDGVARQVVVVGEEVVAAGAVDSEVLETPPKEARAPKGVSKQGKGMPRFPKQGIPKQGIPEQGSTMKRGQAFLARRGVVPALDEAMIDDVALDACIRKLAALKVPKAFISIILLVYWLDPKPPFCNETFDVIELYAGALAILGVECSTFVFMNQGQGFPSVVQATLVASGTCLLLVLLAVLGHNFIVENPGSSVLGYFPRFSWMCSVLKEYGVADQSSEKPLHEIFAELSWDSTDWDEVLKQRHALIKEAATAVDASEDQKGCGADEKTESERLAEDKELQRQAKEKAELERQDLQRQAKEKAELERQELQRQAEEKAELERQELQRQAQEKAELERQELQRQAKEKAEREQKTKELQEEAKRQAQEKKELELRAKEQEEAERQAKEKELQRQAKEKAELQQKAKEQEEAKCQAREKELQRQVMEKERQLQELLKERMEAEQKTLDRELQRQAKEKAELERKAKEQEESERQAKEKAEQERRAKEQEEATRQAHEEAKRQAQEEAQRQAKEQEEAARQKHEEAKRQAEEKAELEQFKTWSREALMQDIDTQRAKKADLAAKQAKLAELQKQLVDVLGETDALMQSQQAPLIPGVTKLETLRSQLTDPNGTAVPTGNIEPRNLQLAIPKGQPPTPAKGLYKMAKCIRDQFNAGGVSKDKVLKLFAACDHKPVFLNKFSVEREKHIELETEVDFEFLTKKEMAEDQNMTPADIEECVAQAELDPKRKIRKHPYKIGHLRYYCEIKVKGHNKCPDLKRDSLTMTETMEAEAFGSGLDMEVDLEEALEQGSLPESMTDAADGAVKSGPLNEDLSKLLKLFRPAPDDRRNWHKCCQHVSNQKKKMQLPHKRVKGMYAKIRAVYSAVDACCEKLQKHKAEGVLDGYNEKTILPTMKPQAAGKAQPKVIHSPATLFVCWLSEWPMAPACVIGETAEAVVADGSATQNIREATKVDKSHSERNAHRMFNRYGLALRVPISYMDVPQSSSEDSVTVPYLKITDFLKHLLNKFEEVLFAGLKADSDAARDLCSTFWSRYQSYHGDHVIYSEVPAKDRSFCVPLLVHGDKGRTLQKSPIFVMSFELVWGISPSMLKKVAYDCRNTRYDTKDGHLQWHCGRRASGKRTFRDMCFDSCPLRSAGRFNPETKGNHQRHNNRGHSFLSRFLIGAIPSKLYSRNAEVLPCLLKQAAEDLKGCFQEGLLHEKSGMRFRFVFIGAKGDAEWHFDAGIFNRSYHRTGTVNAAPICPLCEAGTEGVSYTDVSDAPEWLASMGTSVPWDTTPPLNLAPFSTTFPANLYKFDPFHVLKFGIFRDAVASTIVRLALMGYFDLSAEDYKNITDRLARAYSLYKLWCLAANKNPSLKGFTKANFNFAKMSKFAWVNAKGSEVTMLMQWLDFLVPSFAAEPKQASDLVFLRAASQMFSYKGAWSSLEGTPS
ncbi:unnamed protein product [Symbiodinium sp. CCMP2592]|nr:unnamed protein product [Symbiodinium sp. CCMP2592]